MKRKENPSALHFVCPRPYALQAGFSLVELSIVLVILGLLVGGILAGRNLIRSAELQGTITELDRHKTAILIFQDKYSAYPGDFDIAERFWDTDPDGCPEHTTRVAKSETCNGNGDGVVANAGNRYEMFRAWQHLSNAGLVAGSFTGVRGSEPTSGPSHAIIGDNVPAAKLSSAGFSFQAAGMTSSWYAPQQNSFLLGGNDAGGASLDNLIGNALTSAEAWNVDTKLDDGKPGTGWMVVHNHTARPFCADSDDAAQAEYLLGEELACVGMFQWER